MWQGSKKQKFVTIRFKCACIVISLYFFGVDIFSGSACVLVVHVNESMYPRCIYVRSGRTCARHVGYIFFKNNVMDPNVYMLRVLSVT